MYIDYEHGDKKNISDGSYCASALSISNHWRQMHTFIHFWNYATLGGYTEWMDIKDFAVTIWVATEICT